jgi:hypothetical protein
MLDLCPMELDEANAYIEAKHRHHGPVIGHKFSIGVQVVLGRMGVRRELGATCQVPSILRRGDPAAVLVDHVR